MRICHIVYGYFPFDPRVRREVETLARMGHDVDVIAMKEVGEVREEIVLGVRVHRVPWPVIRGGRVRYMVQYSIFFLLATMRLMSLHLRRPFHVIHVHSLPDFLVFAGLPEKAMGAGLVLDLHEAMPEILEARFPRSHDGPLVGLARALENVSCAVADGVLVVNDAIREILICRGVESRKITVVMNSPDPANLVARSLEQIRENLGLDGVQGIVYVGGINPERDLGLLIRAAARLRARHPLRIVIYGYGDEDYRRSLIQLAREEGLEGDLLIGPRLAAEDVFSYVSLSAIGPITYARNPLTEIAVPNKVFEYAAAGKPLVIADLPALRKLFSDAALFYQPGNVGDLAEKIERLLENPQLGESLAQAASRILEACGWDIMRRRLIEAYRSVTQVPEPVREYP